MKIVYVIPRLAYAGAEKHLSLLAGGMRRRGHTVAIVCTSTPGPLGERLAREGFDLVSLGVGRPHHPALFFRLFRLLRAARPDVLQTYLFGFHLFAGMAGRAAGVPRIVSTRREMAVWKRRRHALFERAGNRFADVVVANSEAVRRRVLETEGLPPGKVGVIYNGLPPAAPRPARPAGGPPVAAMVARFTPEKGHEVFLHACARLAREHPSLRIRLAGGGPLLEPMRRLAADLGIAERTEFAGVVDDIPAFLADASVLVLPSFTEGLPNAVIEALLLEVPVVASAVGGVPEIMAHREHGLLVEPGDPEMLAGAIDRLLKDPDQARRMARAGRERAEAVFSLDAMLDGYLSVYSGRGFPTRKD